MLPDVWAARIWWKVHVMALLPRKRQSTLVPSGTTVLSRWIAGYSGRKADDVIVAAEVAQQIGRRLDHRDWLMRYWPLYQSIWNADHCQVNHCAMAWWGEGLTELAIRLQTIQGEELRAAQWVP